jgi:CRISPR-associated protein Csm3
MAVDLAFKGKYIISGEIVCETGLHIGGSTEGFEIGGVDNPVIRDPLTEWPYIPGSSLRGKLRHLLEWSLGKIEKHPKHKSYTAHFCGECDACVLFGPASDKTEVRMKAGPSRLTVRDAFPTEATRDKWETWMGKGIYTDLNPDHALDRVTSEANPRPMERVPAGSAFEFEMVFDDYRDEDVGLLKSLFTAMHLLENSALGGSGSRGHGKVRFENLAIKYRPLAYYRDGTGEVKIKLPEKKDVQGIIAGFDAVQWEG